MRHNLPQNFDTFSFIFPNSAEASHLVYLYDIYFFVVSNIDFDTKVLHIYK